jgi:hypothetical protein
MNCPKCGSPNPDNATMCHACGSALANPYQAPGVAGGGPRPEINNYLIPAIFSTVCCCLPFGIVSIVYAAQVNGKLAAGDIVGAERSAANAKMWFWIAFGVGLVVVGLNIVLSLVGGLANIQQQGNF